MKSQKKKSHIIQKDKEDIGNKEKQKEIRLDEKRCLTIKEFQAYLSIGRNNALKLAKKSKTTFRIGKRILVDRVAFDEWLDKQKKDNTEQEHTLL